MRFPPPLRFFFPGLIVAFGLAMIAVNTWWGSHQAPLPAHGPSLRKDVVFQTAALLSGGVVMLVAFHFLASRRMDRLVEEASRIAAGKPPLDPVTGADEIAHVSRALHDASHRLHQSGRDIQNLKTALDESAIVAITDAQGRITYVNDKFTEISRYPRSELIGQDHRIINSGVHTSEFFQDLWRTIGRGRVWRGEICNRAKDGSLYWVFTTIVPFLGPNGKPEQYIAIRADITAQKMAEGRLALLARELDEKNKELETLIYAASHDLRSPLVNVQGFATVIEDQVTTVQQMLSDAAQGRAPDPQAVEDANEEITRAIQFITAGASKMDALLRGLLLISRVGRAAVEVRPLDMNQLVNASLAAMNFQLEGVNAEVVVEPLPSCLADEGLLGQVLSNLFDNAIRYHSPDRRLKLHVSGSLEGGRAVYHVADNGIGIEPEHRDKVFELFHRLNPRDGSDGHGLGLSIVRRALDRMDGQIGIVPDRHPGTCFRISLPA